MVFVQFHVPFAKPCLVPVVRLMKMMPLLLPPMTLTTTVMKPPEPLIYFLTAPLPSIKISHDHHPDFIIAFCLLYHITKSRDTINPAPNQAYLITDYFQQ
jgi:hypothetical protein